MPLTSLHGAEMRRSTWFDPRTIRSMRVSSVHASRRVWLCRALFPHRFTPQRNHLQNPEQTDPNGDEAFDPDHVYQSADEIRRQRAAGGELHAARFFADVDRLIAGRAGHCEPSHACSSSGRTLHGSISQRRLTSFAGTHAQDD